ncbi:MAG: type IV pilus modification protein PilV [Candidatus Thiodiazotropha sp.]
MSLITYRQRHQGMTLIEVLIAAVIVAIGLLGVASLQIAALQGSSNADYRSRAIDYATALSDRMHANLIAVADNEYLGSPDCETWSGAALPNCSMTPTMDSASSVGQCTPQQVAIFDLHQISCGTGIEQRLPDGRLLVTCLDADSTDADICSDLSRLLIRVSWQHQARVTDLDPDDVDEVVLTVIPGVP